jgi:hypothetical protein
MQRVLVGECKWVLRDCSEGHVLCAFILTEITIIDIIDIIYIIAAVL